MWGLEATFAELVQAWAQRAYTDRQLARALHLAGFDYGPRMREINQWATKSCPGAYRTGVGSTRRRSVRVPPGRRNDAGGWLGG